MEYFTYFCSQNETATPEMDCALYLIPVSLGDAPLSRVLPAWNASVVGEIRCFIVENVRSARRFLRQMDPAFPIDDCTFMEMGKHANERLFGNYLEPLRRGQSVGVISEAGCPAVADPGALVVELAQRQGLRVVPLVGPSSMIMAVMSSGLNGQSFAFNGYLPVEPADRAKRLKALEARAWQEGQTQLFIETPFRNRKMFDALVETLRPQTRLCIAAGITTPDEWIRTKSVQEWRQTALPDLSKTPAIFLIGR